MSTLSTLVKARVTRWPESSSASAWWRKTAERPILGDGQAVGGVGEHVIGDVANEGAGALRVVVVEAEVAKKGAGGWGPADGMEDADEVLDLGLAPHANSSTKLTMTEHFGVVKVAGNAIEEFGVALDDVGGNVPVGVGPVGGFDESGSEEGTEVLAVAVRRWGGHLTVQKPGFEVPRVEVELAGRCAAGCRGLGPDGWRPRMGMRPPIRRGVFRVPSALLRTVRVACRKGRSWACFLPW